MVEDKSLFMIELDQKHYGCTVTDEHGDPRGCHVEVMAKKNRNSSYDSETIYPYARLPPGPARTHGPHEDECGQAPLVNAKWGTKEITKYRRLF